MKESRLNSFFLRTGCIFVLFPLFGLWQLHGQVKYPDAPYPDFTKTSNPGAQWFADAGLGLFIHWGISSVDGKGDLSWYMMDGNIGGSEPKISPEQYWKLAEKFNPEKYDPDKWFKPVRAAGFRYVVLTTRHHDGFALWPSASGDFSTRNFIGGRDLVKLYVDAARANGLRVGFYYSGPDWHFIRDYMNFHAWEAWEGNGFAKDPSPRELDYRYQPVHLPERTAMEKMLWSSPLMSTHGASDSFLIGYMAHIATQVEELLTRYGKIDILWFDGSGPAALPVERIRELQPGIVINNRFYKGGDFTTPEDLAPKTRPQGWWEQCACWNQGWGYKSDEKYRSLAAVLSEFVKTRAWGGNYLINVGPRPNGELPDVAYERFRGLQDWLKYSGESVFGTEAGEWPDKCNVPSTCKPGVLYLHLLPEFREEVVVKTTSRPEQVKLLRTGAKLSYVFKDSTLRVKVPESLRTDLVDVVAVNFRK